MILLRHNNVDNYPSTWGKFQKEPTQQELADILKDYWPDKAEALAKELAETGQVDVDNGSCDTFELETV